MATHSSVLAWRIPGMGEPGGTPVFLPGESQGRGSLVGRCLWGRTESDTTEATQQQQQQQEMKKKKKKRNLLFPRNEAVNSRNRI